MSFPLIYCNGDSYSDENYHESLIGKTYAHYGPDGHEAFARQFLIPKLEELKIL